MIVSFHPLFEADKNIICAGREPDVEDLSSIMAADAVILPQGCRRSLYEMARNHCDFVFPNYEARFKYPGKIGQIELFRKTKTSHPRSAIFKTVAAFHEKFNEITQKLPFAFPVVFKFNWGGEGDTVYLIQSMVDLHDLLGKAAAYEKSSQSGFIIQEYIPDQKKTLRVVIIGRRAISYWRVRQETDSFRDNLSRGAVINTEAEPQRQHLAVAFVKNFCKKTGVDLAGFDIIFSPDSDKTETMLLEINYFFGRKGLGGSESYYRILQQEIQSWLNRIGYEL